MRYVHVVIQVLWVESRTTHAHSGYIILCMFSARFAAFALYFLQCQEYPQYMFGTSLAYVQQLPFLQ